MRYYANVKLKSTMVDKTGNLKMRAPWVQVSESVYNRLNGPEGKTSDWATIINPPTTPPAPPTTPENPSVITVVSGSVPDPEVSEAKLDEDDPLNLVGSLIETEEEEDGDALEINASVSESLQAELDNSFEKITVLRDRADKERPAKVTKGKSHGVYEYDGEAWVRVSDL